MWALSVWMSVAALLSDTPMRWVNSFVMRSSESPRTKPRESVCISSRVSLSLSAQMREENSLPAHGTARMRSMVCGSILANVLATSACWLTAYTVR